MSGTRLLPRAMDGVLRLSSRWWLLAGVVGLNVVSFQLLFWLESRFEAISGQPTLDTQNTLTRAQVADQLPLYTGPGRDAYLLFSAFDFVFPLVAGLTVAVVATTLLRYNPRPSARRALALGLPLLALLGTAFDYLENIAFLTLLSGDLEDPADAVVAVALLFKSLKLLVLAASGLGVAALAVWLAVARVTRRRGRAVSRSGTGGTSAPQERGTSPRDR